MKKLFLFIFFLFFGSLPAHATINIVTTTTDLADLAKSIGGDLVSVKSLARGDQDPHFMEPKPSFAVLLNKADLVIQVGLALESGWLPVLLTQSRNPKIQNGTKGNLIPTAGIRVLEVFSGSVDRSMGDVHPSGNPHYWLDPRNGIIIASNITHRLKELDPKNNLIYEKNFRNFSSNLQNKIKAWETQTKNIRGKKIITYHKSFSYLVNWLGLNVKGYVEPKPGIPPSPKHILELIELIQSEKIPLIITENYYDRKSSFELAKRTATKEISLASSVHGDKGTGSYEAMFDYLIQNLIENF